MPRLTIDLNKIEDNARLVVELLRPQGVRLVGVTKACLGHPLVGEAMLAGGAASLADSRTQNIANLRRRLPDASLQLIRTAIGDLPSSENQPDLFFVSSGGQAKAARADHKQRVMHACLMIETGDGREGVPPELAVQEAVEVFEMDGVEFAGLGTNAACARQPASLKKTLSLFHKVSSEVTNEISRRASREVDSFPVLSGGGSGLLALVLDHNHQSPDAEALLKPLTELRCGEAILLGRIPGDQSEGRFLPGAHRDAFVIDGQVLEIYKKEGRNQALLDFGLQDVGSDPLLSRAAGIMPRSATGDYLAVWCTDSTGQVRIGDRLAFIPTYYGLVAAMTSPFVEKIFM